MKRHTIKRLCGVAGLLAVGAMTVVAVNMPGPEVQAAEDNTSTTITVTVKESVVRPSIVGENADGDPILKVEYSEPVCRTQIQAIHLGTGQALFNPELEYVIRESSNNLQASNEEHFVGSFEMILPFLTNGASLGDYSIIVSACGCDGKALGSATTQYSYSAGGDNPVVPKTGNTGELNVLGVNLARADFIAIGLLILAAAIVCIVLAVRKKNHPTPKRR